MKKTLLIGGAGFIGLNILSRLADRGGYELTIADNFFRGKRDRVLEELTEKHGIKIVENDFTDPRAFDELETDYDYVYMLASMVGVEYTAKMPNEIIRVNTALILNTLEWLKSSSCKKVLYTSTSECYAGTIEEFDYAVPTPESVPLTIADISHPRFTYAVTKMLGESGFFNYARVCDFETTIVRYHNIYGARMGFKHVIPQLVQRYIADETPFLIYGHDQTRSFCHIDDAVSCTISAMEHEKASGEIFHVGADQEITISELTKATGEMMGYQGAYENAPTFPGSVSRRCPDITKSRSVLGYEPRIDWRDGLKETVDWYREYFESGKEVFE